VSRGTKKVQALIKRKSGIMLDVSLGGPPQPRSIALRIDGDVRHHPAKVPFPLPNECVHTAIVLHVLEYLEPKTFFRWWDELWRVMQPNGVVYVSGPYGGDESQGWLSDPEHKTRVIEQTFAWLDPRTPVYAMHADVGRKRPKPWYPLTIARVPGTHGTFGYNVTMRKPSAKEMR